MPKNGVLLALSLALLVFALGCTSPNAPAPTIEPKKTPTVCFERAQQCFFVDVARTTAEHQKGLMGRTRIDDNEGMLFVFDTAEVRAFWMKNTLVPLDMIWIDDMNRIAGITTLASPCNADPCPQYQIQSPTRFVLEIRGGGAKAMGIIAGDRMKYTHD